MLKQFILFSEYNQLMNLRQYAAAGHLTAEQLNKDQNAFFKSILGTLNHILVGDIIWLRRFAVHPSSKASLSSISRIHNPTSLDEILYPEYAQLKQARQNIDRIIIDWVNGLSESDINECITYSNMAGDRFSKPIASLISHLFLHQVHHRGQITTLLSQYDVDFGETDLIELIPECSL